MEFTVDGLLEARNGWSRLSHGFRERCRRPGPLGEGLTERRGAHAGRADRSTPPYLLQRKCSMFCPSSNPSSKQDQPQPQLYPGICILPKPEFPSQAGWAQFLNDRSRSLSCTFDFNFSSLWKRKNAESQVSDLGEGSGCLLG